MFDFLKADRSGPIVHALATISASVLVTVVESLVASFQRGELGITADPAAVVFVVTVAGAAVSWLRNFSK